MANLESPCCHSQLPERAWLALLLPTLAVAIATVLSFLSVPTVTPTPHREAQAAA